MAYPGVDQDSVAWEKEGVQRSYDNITLYDVEESSIDEEPPGYVLFRGKWGYSDDNESDGYLEGKIIRRERGYVLKGRFNFIGNESEGTIQGIMKRGYFNGRVTLGGKSRITGLYKVDMEKHILKFRWMTPSETGWAVAKITIPD
jgi:hypothetical protein